MPAQAFGLRADAGHAVEALLCDVPATTLVPLTVQSEGGPGEYASVLSVATIAASVVTMPLVFAVLGG